MLELGVYAVFDVKAGVYGRPWYAENDGVARRLFSDGVNDPETPVARHPEDYTLFCVGSWDSASGKLAGREPEAVVNGLVLKERSDG